MNVTSEIRQRTPPPIAVGLVAAAGSAAALVATYWDDSWHTDKGRDEFAIPPHLLLYAGVGVASLAVGLWGLLAWRRCGWGAAGIRHVLGQPGLLLAGLGGVTTLASAPVDAAWHERFGRDAVLWSPPHLAAVAGTLALAVGLLAGLRWARGTGAGTARLLAAAAVIGTLQVPVLEYDSDVPQFATLWFLPVAALGVCVAIALLQDLLPGRWSATSAAGIYTLLRAGTVALLAGLGFSLTAVPPVAVVMAAVAVMTAWPLGARLVAAGALTPVLWWPALRLQADVTTIVPASELPASVVLGAAAGALVALAHGDLLMKRRPLTPAGVAATATGILLVTTFAAIPPVWAHDPGQGEAVQSGTLTVTRGTRTATLTMELTQPCALEPVATVARRAGTTVSGPLLARDVEGRCTLSGRVEGLSAGRWFVYAQARGPRGEALEAWLPVRAEESVTESRPLYVAPAADGTGARDVAGATLLTIVAALLVTCLRVARRVAAEVDRPRPST